MNSLLETLPIWLPGVLTMAALILVSAFFSGSETALFYLSREELRRLQTGGAGARLAAQLMRNPERLLTVVLFWNLVINLAYFAVGLVTVKRLLTAEATTLAGVLSVLSLLLMILCGEVIPKSLAVILRRQIAAWVSVPLSLAIRLLDPILPILNSTTRGLRRMIWPNLVPEPYLELDDIEKAIESTEVGTELIQLEQQILGRILELSEMTAEEVMRPRGTYTVVAPPLKDEHLAQRIGTCPYLFVAEEDLDTITRAIPLAELSVWVPDQLESLSEPVLYVPWCTPVAESLSRLRAKGINVAVVINEYGETIGVLTEDDIIDTFVNPESSRGRRLLDREPIRELPDGRILVEGVTTLRYLAQWLEVDYDPSDEAQLTVVALMHDDLERFPLIGDESIWEGFRFRVVQAGGPGESIQVEILKDDSQTLPANGFEVDS